MAESDVRSIKIRIVALGWLMILGGAGLFCLGLWTLTAGNTTLQLEAFAAASIVGGFFSGCLGVWFVRVGE